MKRNLNQKLINLIEYYNLINANFLLSNNPLKRTIQSATHTFTGTKLEKLNKLKKKIQLIKNCDLKKNDTNVVFGYGNINSNIWFIGYEEGSSSNSVKELKQRVNVWMKLDKEVLCDCKDFHLNLKMGNEEPFTVGKNQPTWSRYIDILTLYSKNYKLNKPEKQDYLRKKFAKLNSNHALLELFPIPCTSIPSWSYKDLE